MSSGRNLGGTAASHGMRRDRLEKLRIAELRSRARAAGVHFSLMVRDARTLFIYWELPAKIRARTARSGIIRIYDLTRDVDGRGPSDYYDLPIGKEAGTRYIRLNLPAHRFRAAIGLEDGSGRFKALAYSAEVTTPPDRTRRISRATLSFLGKLVGLPPDTKEIRLSDLDLPGSPG